MDSQKGKERSDEVDFGVLFSKIGNSLKSAWLSVMRLLAALRRVPLDNRLSFALIIGASTLIGIGYGAYLKTDYFESTMILSSDYLNRRLVENMISKLNALASEKNKTGLKKTLDLSDSVARNLIGFKVKPFVPEADLIELEVLKEQLKNAQGNAKNEKVIAQVINRIEIENRHAFEVTLLTLDPSSIGSLQNSLVSYFKTNDYVRKRIEIHRANLLAKRKELAEDRAKLDSLKEVIYSNYRAMATQARQGSNNVILSDRAVTNPIDIYNQDLTVYSEIQSIDAKLYVEPDFEVIDGFTEFTEPANFNTVELAILSLFVGIIMAYLDVAVRTFNRYLASLE